MQKVAIVEKSKYSTQSVFTSQPVMIKEKCKKGGNKSTSPHELFVSMRGLAVAICMMTFMNM